MKAARKRARFRERNDGVIRNRLRARPRERQGEIVVIERRRIQCGLTQLELVAGAGIGMRTYERGLAGTCRLQRGTIYKLKKAIERHAGERPVLKAAPLLAFYRAAAVVFARERGLDADAVLHDDGIQRSQNKAWQRLVHTRMMAVYVVCVELEVPPTTLAGAIGLSRQNVSKSLTRIEDMRDDPKVDALIERVTRMVTGRDR